MADTREQLRTTFEQDPELYERARPSYPDAVFDDLLALAELSPGARLLEIGCGTGQATRALAARGYALTCVELGAGLAAVARRQLRSFPDVEVVVADFEAWQPARAEFDAVVAFSSFHWLDPARRYQQTADLLREQGKLAFVSAVHVLPEDGDPFFVAVQADYEAVVPDDPNTKAAQGAGRPPRPDEIAAKSDAVVFAELAGSGRYRLLGARRHLWDVVYTADEYVAVLATYSGHRALAVETRERLLERIHRRVLAQPGGQVRKTYLALVYVAARL